MNELATRHGIYATKKDRVLREDHTNGARGRLYKPCKMGGLEPSGVVLEVKQRKT